jgi:hypothetical protein
VCLLQERTRHANDLAVRIAFRFHQSVSVFHRRANIRMTKQLLLNTYRRTGCIQPRAVRVTERVPADGLESDLLPGGTNVVLLDRARVIAAISERAREDPVARGLRATLLTPPSCIVGTSHRRRAGQRTHDRLTLLGGFRECASPRN